MTRTCIKGEAAGAASPMAPAERKAQLRMAGVTLTSPVWLSTAPV